MNKREFIRGILKLQKLKITKTILKNKHATTSKNQNPIHPTC